MYSLPSMNDTSVRAATPKTKSPGFNERVGMRIAPPVEQSDWSPHVTPVRPDPATMPSVTPGIPVTWSTKQSKPHTVQQEQVAGNSDRQSSESMSDFKTKMRVMFADSHKKTTAQHPPDKSNDDLREDFKKVSSSVKELISAIEKRSKEMRDQATQASGPVSKVKTVDVVFPMDLHGTKRIVGCLLMLGV